MRTSIDLAAAGQNDGDRRAQRHTGRERAEHAGNRSQQQRARLEAGHDEHIRVAGDFRLDTVGARRGGGNRAVRRQRPVDDTAA